MSEEDYKKLTKDERAASHSVERYEEEVEADGAAPAFSVTVQNIVYVLRLS